MKDFILWWPRFFKEAWITWKYRKIVRSIEEELESEANLRVDWLGRVYTVINIKEEFQTQPDLVQQSIVFKELAHCIWTTSGSMYSNGKLRLILIISSIDTCFKFKDIK